jgi:hypothetical protein
MGELGKRNSIYIEHLSPSHDHTSSSGKRGESGGKPPGNVGEHGCRFGSREFGSKAGSLGVNRSDAACLSSGGGDSPSRALAERWAARVREEHGSSGVDGGAVGRRVVRGNPVGDASGQVGWRRRVGGRGMDLGANFVEKAPNVSGQLLWLDAGGQSP